MPESSRLNSSAGFAGVVLAAGRGSRMGSSIPKVMLDVAGVPMVGRVVQTLMDAGAAPVCVVVSPESDLVRGLLGERVVYALQPQPEGTGDAVATAVPAVEESPHVVVACGDSPLFLARTVRRLMDEHLRTAAALTLVTAHLDDPSGYGRVLRDDFGRIVRVVEEVVASAKERAVREVNGGLYAFSGPWLRANLARPAGAGREFVLTEIVSRAVEQGRPVSSVECVAEELAGVNTPAQLEQASRILLERLPLKACEHT